MICFGAKTDQEVKENGHVGPTLKNKIKKYNKKNKIKLKDGRESRAKR